MQKNPPAGSAATVLLSSDDELSKTASQSPPRRKRPPRKSMSRKRGKSPARVTKTDDKKQEDVKAVNVSSTAPIVFTRTYELRSTSKRREAATKLLSFSDDESSPVADSRATKKPTRMSLSESKFRKHLADNRKDSTHPTSTPFTQPSPAITTTVKTRLHFSPDKTTRKTRSSARVLSQEEEVTIAEDTDEQHAPDKPQPSTQKEEEKENKKNKEERVPAWLHVGWAEFGLASFVTGLAVVGYYFFSS